jgi:hypothetical protein
VLGGGVGVVVVLHGRELFQRWLVSVAVLEREPEHRAHGKAAEALARLGSRSSAQS